MNRIVDSVYSRHLPGLSQRAPGRPSTLARCCMAVFACIVGLPCTVSAADAPDAGIGESAASDLAIEILSPPEELVWTGGSLDVDVEGLASAIGGIRYLDIVLVIDESASLENNDPKDFRTAGAIGLVNGLTKKSDTNIGVIGFGDEARLAQELTANRGHVVGTLGEMTRDGGTNIAAGILAGVEELDARGREESSRVIMLFTDGKSNKKRAFEAAEHAKSRGIVVQALLLGSAKKGVAILEEIAQKTGGSFLQVTDPERLPEAFLGLRTTGIDSVSLSVNGSRPMPAAIEGTSFSGSVGLAIGQNELVARATSLEGQTREATLNVNVRDGSCAALEVAATVDGRPALSLNDRAVQLVVDASNSMWGRMEGEPKISVAKEILVDAAEWLPNDMDLALRAYGSESGLKSKDCDDSKLLVPFDDLNRAAIREALEGLQPKGQTPIAYALRQSAFDFGTLDREKTVILVTDGLESCNGNPASAAAELRNIGIVVHVIGFGLGSAEDEDTASLAAIAEAGGGQYLSAGSAQELRAALETTVGTRFRVMQDDRVVARSALGFDEQLFLPPGDYRVELESVPPRTVALNLAPQDNLKLTLEKVADIVSQAERRGQLEATSCEAALGNQGGAE